MKELMKNLVKVLLVLSIIDLAMIIGNRMGINFPWVKASIIGAAMLIFAVGFYIGTSCEKPKKYKPTKHKPSTPPSI